MIEKNYRLSYLPIFEDDLAEIADYISITLRNLMAAMELVGEIERAILKRKKYPLAFEPYTSSRTREYPYYRIYVGHYVVYYVVIDDVMELRRVLYQKRSSETPL